MNAVEQIEFLARILSQKGVAADLLQALTQVTNTTRNVRRERALAYLLDAITGERPYKWSNDGLLAFYDIADRLKAVSKQSEVVVACERTLKRLTFMLNDPTYGKDLCVACNTYYKGEDHKCDPQKIARKDLTMSRDNSVR